MFNSSISKMSDSLKDRLTQHSQAFESLLSLIPARYYYDEETSNQWKKKGMRKSDEAKEEAKRNKKDKFDPTKGSTALDELKRREQFADEVSENATEGKVDKVTVYDDNGNPINDDNEEISVQDLLKLKSIEKLNPGEFKLKSSDDSSATNSLPAKKSKKSNAPNSDSEALQEDSNHSDSVQSDSTEGDSLESKQSAPSTKETRSEQQQSTAKDSVIQAKGSSTRKPAETSEHKTTKFENSKPGIEALRAKLAAKVDEMRAKRKAPGSNAPGVPKNREELLAARKLKLEQKKKLKNNPQEEKEPENPASESEEEDPDTTHQSSAPLDMNLSFGQVQFKDGDKLAKDTNSIVHDRKVKKRNATDQLKVLENKKAKLSKLDSEKQKEISENAKWSRAILQSEGAKVRDDEKLLKKTIKQTENRKKRSEKEWNRRIHQTKKGISDREAKRDANIAAHKEAKKMKLRGKKRKEHMKKASNNFKAR